MRGKVIIAQGGGPTVVINQSLVGAILELRKFPGITRVWGALHGVQGIIKGKFLDLSEAEDTNLEKVALTPSAALGSTRNKPDIKNCQSILNVFQKHNVRYFFYIGGNDSSETVRIIKEYADQQGYEICAVHIPKTVDNDLPVTDHCPGYPSAASFVTYAFSGLNADNIALPGVHIAVIMGRNTGWLTAAAALARKHNDDGPHLIYLPERRFLIERYLSDVEHIYRQHGRCIVAVSEGVWTSCDSAGKGIPVSVDLMRASGYEPDTDAHGNIHLAGGRLAEQLAQIIRNKFGIKRVNGDTFGYIQRSFPGLVSNIDALEARKVGEKAVQYACGENMSGSVVIKRIGDYSVQYDLVDIREIASKTRYMPDRFINTDCNNVTEEFRKYLYPLLGINILNMERLSAPELLFA
jgi:6-phosphofructokinase 1